MFDYNQRDNASLILRVWARAHIFWYKNTSNIAFVKWNSQRFMESILWQQDCRWWQTIWMIEDCEDDKEWRHDDLFYSVFCVSSYRHPGRWSPYLLDCRLVHLWRPSQSPSHNAHSLAQYNCSWHLRWKHTRYWSVWGGFDRYVVQRAWCLNSNDSILTWVCGHVGGRMS